MPYPYEPQQIPAEFDLDDLVVTPPDVDYLFHEKTTQVFAVPAPLGTVGIDVEESARYAIGVPLYFAGFGIFLVTGLPSDTSITVESITATEGESVPIGTPFCVCALPETTEEDEDTQMYDVLAAGFTLPAVGNEVEITVVRGGWFLLNAIFYVAGAGWYRITNPYVGSDRVCTAEKLYTNGSPDGGTVSAGAFILPVGELPFSADGVTIVTSNPTNTAGEGLLSTGPTIPKTPDLEDQIIQTGATAPSAGWGPGYVNAVITFPIEFGNVPVVTFSPLVPNYANNNFVYYLTALSETGMTITIYASTTTGADSQMLWIAIGDPA